MRCLHRQKSSMTTKPEPLQGSLFGDARPVQGRSKMLHESSSDVSQDISDEELTKDAQQRPRQRKLISSEEEASFSLEQNHQGSNSNQDDLPPWSNRSSN